MRCVVSLAVALAACTPAPRIALKPTPTTPAIGTITLSLSNVHVVYGEHPLLVDTGSPGDLFDLEKGLRQLGVRVGQLKCAIVTHGHADHAANARALQQRGVTIVAGSGDMWREVKGVHGKLKSTSFFAELLKLIIPKHYTPFWPDVKVKDRFDLHPCGVDGEAIVVAGHTAGSLVVLVGGGKIALVGDLFRGGALAGYVHPTSPKEHFYQEDLALVHRRIRELLARGVQTFVLGHGGPASRADVERWLAE